MTNAAEHLSEGEESVERAAAAEGPALERGFHYSTDGKTKEITKMPDRYLDNCIQKGRRDGGAYWDWALPQMEEEVVRRAKAREEGAAQ